MITQTTIALERKHQHPFNRPSNCSLETYAARDAYLASDTLAHRIAVAELMLEIEGE